MSSVFVTIEVDSGNTCTVMNPIGVQRFRYQSRSISRFIERLCKDSKRFKIRPANLVWSQEKNESPPNSAIQTCYHYYDFYYSHGFTGACLQKRYKSNIYVQEIR